MKKLVLLLVLLGCGCGVRAQRGWSVSPRVGVACSIRDGDPFTMAGFYTGLLGQYRLGRVWALEPGLLYSLEFATRRMGSSGTSMLHLPVQLKAYVRKGWNLTTGPQFGALFDDGTDFGFFWKFGTGYDFPGGLVLNFDYGYGSSEAFEFSGPGHRHSLAHRLQIGLGLRIGKGNWQPKRVRQLRLQAAGE